MNKKEQDWRINLSVLLFLTYQGSPPLLSYEGESGELEDFFVSGGMQTPSDKLR